MLGGFHLQFTTGDGHAERHHDQQEERPARAGHFLLRVTLVCSPTDPDPRGEAANNGEIQMVMPRQDIEAGIKGRVPLIASTDPKQLPINDDQFQPASFDLRLGLKAYGRRFSALPHGKPVSHLLQDQRNTWCEFDLTLDKVNPLPKGQIYVMPLAEELALPPGVYAEFSPKSSTGRCDVFVQVLCNNFSGFDRTPPGYHGPLYLEIESLSHEVGVQAGIPLVQVRFKREGEPHLTNEEINAYHHAEGVLFDFAGEPVPRLDVHNGQLSVHVDLSGEVVGFEALDATTGMLDLSRSDAHDPGEFWRPIYGNRDKDLILMPGKFYLLASEEGIRIPSAICGHLLESVPTMGNLRIHYAGFFDNGYGPENGTKSVFEVRGREKAFRIEHGRPIGAMTFERTTAVPNVLYKGNYRGRQPSLSKHFKHRREAWTGDYWRNWR
jgi:dCTP deaminase